MSHDDHDDFEGTQILLQCPACGADVGYDEVEVVEHDDSKSGCPSCGEATDTEEWFA